MYFVSLWLEKELQYLKRFFEFVNMKKFLKNSVTSVLIIII
jgi:hypothetical protein